MLQIASGILLAMLVLWLLKWLFFGVMVAHHLTVGDTTPQERSAINSAKTRSAYLHRATRLDASLLLTPLDSPLSADLERDTREPERYGYARRPR